MRAKLPFEHLERVDGDIRVTLGDVEINALELLPHHVLVLRSVGRSVFRSSGWWVDRSNNAEVDFLKVVCRSCERRRLFIIQICERLISEIRKRCCWIAEGGSSVSLEFIRRDWCCRRNLILILDDGKIFKLRNVTLRFGQRRKIFRSLFLQTPEEIQTVEIT